MVMADFTISFLLRNMIYNLTGRIDTANALNVDAQIQEAIDKATAPVTSLTFDCSTLDYISSTGLRVVLKYKKAYPSLEVVNVSNDVYSVFEMTGFSRIMTVKKALRKIDLAQCTVLGQGGNGAVYRVNAEEIVKVQHNAENDQVMHNEIARSRAAFVLGVPTAISFDIVDCGEGRLGAVYEALNSDTLGHYVHTDPSQLQAMAVKYAELLKNLHRTEADVAEFGSIKDVYRASLASSVQYYTPEEVKMCGELLDMIPDRSTLVHGDAHTNNILMGADGELMFIDMADTAVGHPIFDYAGIGLAMLCSQSRDDLCLGICGMLPTEVNQFLPVAVACRFGLKDPEEIRAVMGRLLSVSLMKYMIIMGHNTQSVNEFRPLLLNILRQRLFACYEKVRGDIQWFIDHL